MNADRFLRRAMAVALFVGIVPPLTPPSSPAYMAPEPTLSSMPQPNGTRAMALNRFPWRTGPSRALAAVPAPCSPLSAAAAYRVLPKSPYPGSGRKSVVHLRNEPAGLGHPSLR